MPTVTLLPQGRQRYYDNDGLPLAGGKVYTYAAGTSTPQAAYTDADGTVPHTNPIILDAKGEAVIYWAGNYKVNITDSADIQITGWPVDNIRSDPLGVSGALAALNAFIALLLTSVGASLVGFIQAGAGAILRTVQDKLRENVSVEDFGAVGDGVADSSAAVLKANQSLPNGGIINFGVGTFVIGTTAALEFAAAGIKLKGKGNKTIIIAKSSSNLVQLIAAKDGATGFCIEDMVLDGNRGNAGTSSSSFGVFLAPSHCRVRNVEIRNFTATGMFVGSGVAVPQDTVVEHCYFHDIGGVTTTTGFGVGIYGGGTFRPYGLRIESCHFENMYNTIAGFPGDSTAVNLTGTNISFIGNFVKNNHNVQGGQIAFTSDGSTGAPDGNFIVMGNQILHDTIVAGENTTAIEVEGRKAVVTGNICQSLNGDGIRFETSGGDSVIADNVITCSVTGVNLIQVGGAGPRKTLIHGNHILSAAVGLSSQGNPGGVMAVDNVIDASVPTKVAGEANFSLLRGNIGYDPASVTGLVAGASPYTFPPLNYDACYSLQTAGGVISAGVNGINVSTTAFVPIPVKAGQSLTVFWSGSAPVYATYSQQ